MYLTRHSIGNLSFYFNCQSPPLVGGPTSCWGSVEGRYNDHQLRMLQGKEERKASEHYLRGWVRWLVATGWLGCKNDKNGDPETWDERRLRKQPMAILVYGELTLDTSLSPYRRGMWRRTGDEAAAAAPLCSLIQKRSGMQPAPMSHLRPVLLHVC